MPFAMNKVSSRMIDAEITMMNLYRLTKPLNEMLITNLSNYLLKFSHLTSLNLSDYFIQNHTLK